MYGLIRNKKIEQEEKEMSDEKMKGKLEILSGDDEEMRKKLNDFIENQTHIDEKQNKDLVIWSCNW